MHALSFLREPSIPGAPALNGCKYGADWCPGRTISGAKTTTVSEVPGASIPVERAGNGRAKSPVKANGIGSARAVWLGDAVRACHGLWAATLSGEGGVLATQPDRDR